MSNEIQNKNYINTLISLKEIEFYLQKAKQEAWSRSILEEKIKILNDEL